MGPGKRWDGKTSELDFWNKHIPWTFTDLGKKPPYEERRRMRYSYQDFQAQVVGFDQWRDEGVLEVGSGSGIDSAEFARNSAEVTATDATPNGVAETRLILREANLKGNVIQADAMHLSFRDDSFDLVYSWGWSTTSMTLRRLSRNSPESLTTR